MSEERLARFLLLLVAGFFAVLALRLLIIGGWFNFAGAVFLSAISWYLCSLYKKYSNSTTTALPSASQPSEIKTDGRGEARVILPDETEAGSARSISPQASSTRSLACIPPQNLSFFRHPQRKLLISFLALRQQEEWKAVTAGLTRRALFPPARRSRGRTNSIRRRSR
jgi:hypothetical protein